MSATRDSAKRMLVVAPSWVGDAILSHPLLVRLKQRELAAAIDVVAPEWVLPVYRRMPEVSDTFDNPFRHGELALAARRRLGREIASRGYAEAYVLPNSFKSALVPWFAGIPRRVGYLGEARFGVLTDARRLDKQALPLMVERFAWLAQGRNEVLARPVPRPRLVVNAVEASGVRDRLRLPAPEKLACFCPGAEYGPAKRWPAAYFAELAKRLSAEGFSVWLLGSRKDAAIGEEIAQGSAGCAHNLCGATSLDDAVVLLSVADLVVTNDSGLMHVAAALDRPTVAIYGSSSPAFTPPLSDNAHVVKLDLACSPCFERTCPLKHFDCMMKLAPEHVLNTIDNLGVSA